MGHSYFVACMELEAVTLAEYRLKSAVFLWTSISQNSRDGVQGKYEGCKESCRTRREKKRERKEEREGAKMD